MTGWQEFSGSDKDWDDALSTMAGSNLYQSTSWYHMRRALGFECKRFIYFGEDSKVRTMLMASVRRLPFGLCILNSQGGLVGDLTVWDVSLMDRLRLVLKTPFIYLRCFGMRTRTAQDVIALQTNHWTPCLQLIHSGLTMTLTMSEAFRGLTEVASGNWRHNLKRGIKREQKVIVWDQFDAKQVFDAYKKMEGYKNIHAQFSLSELEAFGKAFDLANIVIVTSTDETGEVVALRGAVVAGKTAFDMFAASTKKGREIYSAYVLLDYLLTCVHKKGVTSYDLSGIDPREGQGVLNFKKGTNADPVEYLGEWDFASHRWFRLFANFLMAIQLWRRKRLSK